MDIKGFLKRFSLLNHLNVSSRSRLQECKISRELFYYNKETSRRKLSVPERNPVWRQDSYLEVGRET